MSGPSSRFVVAFLLALALARPGAPPRALGAPALLERPAGPPAALRTVIVLDRATLDGWGIGRPSGVAYDADGSLYVLDATRRRVVKLGGDGAFLHEVELAGADAARLVQPTDLAIDARGSVLVLDRAAGSVLAYDKRGALLASHDFDPSIADDARAAGASILLDSFSRLWLLAPRARDLVRLDDALAPAGAGRFLAPEDSVGLPAAAAIAPSGDAWIADAASGLLRRFRASGALATSTALADSGGPAPVVTALAVDRDGYVFAGDAANDRVSVVAPDGRRVLDRALGGPASPWRPAAIAWSRLDRIAVADPDRGEVQILAVERGPAP
ncbi:MAG: hypothetical protein ACM3JJ_03690 [Hyphomicrobiales bacterium]